MSRPGLLRIALAMLLAAQAGCLGGLRRHEGPGSARTAGAYPDPPPSASTPLVQLLEGYQERLDRTEPPPEQAQPAPAAMRVPPLLPVDQGGSAYQPTFGPLAPRREVNPATILSGPPALHTPDGQSDDPNAGPIAEGPEDDTAPAAQGDDEQPQSEQVDQQASLSDQMAYLEDQLRRNPDDLQLQLRLRLMYVVAGQDDRALAPVPGASEELTREIDSIIRAIIAVRDGAAGGQVDRPEVATQLLHLQSLTHRLMELADLQIPTFRLCRRVDGFGQYQPFESNTFPPGRTQWVIPYFELANFSTQRDENGLYHTRLGLRLQLFDRQGNVVVEREEQNIEDISANRRSDFFHAPMFPLPPSLGPGDYTLRLVVNDTNGNKTASASLPIVIQPIE